MYYTLIWKYNGLACFRSFNTFEQLRKYIKEDLEYEAFTLDSVDKEMTIWYVEVKENDN